jgi:Ca2+-binding EF-hand superfamily protein
LKSTGTVDFYEYALTVAVFYKKDSEVTMNCLFALCDSNRDGFLSQAEVVDVLMVSRLMKVINDDNEPKNIENERENVESLVNKTFTGKTQISLEKFYDVYNESAEIQDITNSIYPFAWLSMVKDDDEETD